MTMAWRLFKRRKCWMVYHSSSSSIPQSHEKNYLIESNEWTNFQRWTLGDFANSLVGTYWSLICGPVKPVSKSKDRLLSLMILVEKHEFCRWGSRMILLISKDLNFMFRRTSIHILDAHKLIKSEFTSQTKFLWHACMIYIKTIESCIAHTRYIRMEF